MRFWEYLFRHDQQLDLSKPKTALTWLQSQPWGPRGQWTERTRANWTRNILALRSLAQRLKGKRRLRQPALRGIEADRDADCILFDYQRRMAPCLIVKPPGGLLTASNLLGRRLLPTVALQPPIPLDKDGRHLLTRQAVELPIEAGKDDMLGRLFFWRDDGDVFWQVVFESLLDDSNVAVCQTCGAVLGERTPTGRKKKQTQCSRCRSRAWWNRQSTERKRQRRRQDYVQKKKRAAKRVQPPAAD